MHGDWQARLKEEIRDAAAAKSTANALLALLNRPEARWQAAYGLGVCLSLMAAESMESARVFMRRLMWSLNEESGNLGWGIPEAMGCILAASPALAGEYARIFISYGYETGKEDNFLDHGPLRRGVYWGIGHLAEADAKHALPALRHLVAALAEKDAPICAYAAWALSKLARNRQTKDCGDDAPAWREAATALRREKEHRSAQSGTMVEYLDGGSIVVKSLGEILENALGAVLQNKT